ncbi:Rib/alpha-like domain-containing protein [Streptococcus pyogenes]|nr:hypothetical protein DZ187_03140 [Streptococcus pyogenes]
MRSSRKVQQTFEAPVDTTTPGDKPAKVVVTSDGSKDTL